MSWAAAQLRRRLQEVQALRAGQPVPSPCTCVCRIDPRSGWCEGCFRSLDEVAGWTAMDDEQKRSVWQRLPDRAAARPEEPT